MGRIIGYAQVSSREQNLIRQIEALKDYGVTEENIITDKASGKDLNRPAYISLKIGFGRLVKGDTLVIKSLDRLSRNKNDIQNELTSCASKKYQSKNKMFDTSQRLLRIKQFVDKQRKIISQHFVDQSGTKSTKSFGENSFGLKLL